ncbi:hypothetical protein OGAPHI_004070 [Ogataea philodendri]|uniref:STB6-like N-terminal domain-containing protein n=1 Tax=Ogataea philodendri TaxID=1378263 RepID=A0A9P8T4M4_9ASCO|nr:uncharacterized protein OGAPHI_004070 [Ogataea philodendri]KAH3665881.1 hypothetical protein OGAPHI_004070 [Ogataea philodendri]
MSVSASVGEMPLLDPKDLHLSEDVYTTFIVSDWLTYEHLKETLVGAEDILKHIGVVEMVGYEAYIVEQWITKRLNRNTIVTYTGDSNDMIVCHKVQILNDPLRWPRSFQQYVADLLESKHSSPTETDQGIIHITNLSQLESSLTLIPLPRGDIREMYSLFVVNYNLKKLGCGTRSAMVIRQPTKAVEEKFRNIFQVPTEVSLSYAVREIIVVVQTFLFFYDLIDANLCDGLFCEKTEEAITNWWKLIDQLPECQEKLRFPTGASFSSSILSILGFTLVVKSILEMAGNNINVPKDPLDHEKFRVALIQFQKAYKLKTGGGKNDGYSGKLDLLTLTKLMEINLSARSNQTFAKDLNKMRKLVKNTVIDFTSGKTLQTLKLSAPANKKPLKDQDMASDTRISNCQDIEQIVQLAHGKRLNHLWKNKGYEPDVDKTSLASIAKHHNRQSSYPYGASSIYDDSGMESDPNTTSSSGKALGPSLMSLGPLASDRNRQYEEPLRKQKSKRLIIGGSFQDSEIPSAMSSQVNPYYGDSAEQDDVQIGLFNCRLTRRHSIPSVNKEMNVHTIELLSSDQQIGNEILHSQTPVQSRALRLKRSSSFSLVEDSLTAGIDEFTTKDVVSIECLAVEYLKLLSKYKLDIVNGANDFKQYVYESKMQLVEKLKLSKYAVAFESSKNDYSKLAKRSHEVNDKLVKNYKINARLKYELRLLLQKTKEVETSLKNLNDFKMNVLEHDIQELAATQEASPKVRVERPQKISFSAILDRPQLLLFVVISYLNALWHYLFHQVDNTRIEEQWKLIDRNRRVSHFLEKYYSEQDELETKTK